MTQRACKDCRHYIPPTPFGDGRCKMASHFHKEHGTVYRYASDQRWYHGICGPDANLFARRGNWLTRLFTDGEG